MIAWLMALALAGPVRLDRVDLISEANGTWLHDELPRAGTTPRFAAVRWLEQVQPVIAYDRVQVGLSLRTQTIRYEYPIADGPWRLNGGLQMSAGLPNGAVAGGAWRTGPLRIGASLSAVSTANWVRPVYEGWRWLPTVGIGLGPAQNPGGRRAPWM